MTLDEYYILCLRQFERQTKPSEQYEIDRGRALAHLVFEELANWRQQQVERTVRPVEDLFAVL